MTILERLCWTLILVFGAVCNTRSMKTLKCDPDTNANPNYRRYLFWHSMWHLSLPLGAGLWIIMRWYRVQGTDYYEAGQMGLINPDSPPPCSSGAW